MNMEMPSNDSIDIIAAANSLLEAIYKRGFLYKRSGVIVGDIIPQNQVQLNLFSKNQTVNRIKLYRSIDFINQTMGEIKFRS